MFTRNQNIEVDEKNGADLGDMINTFKGIADNPLSKFFLNRTLDYCQKDEGNRLEVCLDLYLGNREDACNSCKVLSKFVSYIIHKGSSSFGVSEDELKETMQDKYWVKGLSSVIKGIASFGVQTPFVPGAPFQVVWNLSKACNLKCAHCYEDAGKKDENELNRQEVLDGLKIMAKAGVTSIAFSGGEPTIHPHILDFINYTDELGMFPAIATNGYALSKKNVCEKYIENGLKFVQISIDGIEPETHDTFRGVDGAWVKAVQAVKNCVNSDIFVEVATTVTEYNFKEIPDMINLTRDLGADWFMIYNFIPTGNGENIVNLDISPPKRLELLKTAFSENRRGEMEILSTAPQYAVVADSLDSNESKVIPTHFSNPEYKSSSVRQLADFIGGCGAGRFYMSIEPNGDMFPCVFFPHRDEVILGNLLVDDFEDVWKNNNLLKNLRDKDMLEGHCGECESRKICGGCRARAYNYFDNVLAPDPGCINNTYEWNKIRSKILRESTELSNGDILVDLASK